MAYGLKWFSEFSDNENVPYRVEIRERDFLGVPIQVTSADSPFRLELMGEAYGDVYAPMRAKKATVEWMSDVVSGFDISDIFITDEQQFKIVFGSIGEEEAFNILWQGYLVFTDCEEPYLPKPYPVQLAATCSLPTLRDQLFLDADGRFVEGVVSLFDIIQGCLAQTGLDLQIENNIGLIETAGGNPVMLNQTYPDTDGLRGMTAYDVLEGILSSIGAFITQDKNKWVICGVKELTSFETVFYRFNHDGSDFVFGAVDQVATISHQAIEEGIPFVRPTKEVLEKLADPVSVVTNKITPGIAVNRLKNGLFNPNKAHWSVNLGNMDGWAFSPEPKGWRYEGDGKPDDPYRFIMVGSVKATGDVIYRSSGSLQYSTYITAPEYIEINKGPDKDFRPNIKIVVTGAFRGRDGGRLMISCRLNDGDRNLVSWLNESGSWGDPVENNTRQKNIAKRQFIKVTPDAPHNPDEFIDLKDKPLQTFEVTSQKINNWLNRPGGWVARIYFSVHPMAVSSDDFPAESNDFSPAVWLEDFAVCVTTETAYEGEHSYQIDSKKLIRNGDEYEYNSIIADKIDIKTVEQKRDDRRVMTGYLTIGSEILAKGWRRRINGVATGDYEPLQYLTLREKIRLLSGKRRVLEGTFYGSGIWPTNSILNKIDGDPDMFYTITSWSWDVKRREYELAIHELNYTPLADEVITLTKDRNDIGRGDRLYSSASGSSSNGNGGDGSGGDYEEILLDDILPYDYVVKEPDSDFRVCDIGSLLLSEQAPDFIEAQLLYWPDWITEIEIYRGEDLEPAEIPDGGILQIRWKGTPDKVGTFQIIAELNGASGSDAMLSIPISVSPKTIQTHTLIDTGIDGPLILGTVPGAYKLPEKWDLRDKIEGRHDKVEQITKGGGPGGDEIDHTITRDVTETDLATYRPFQDTDGITTLAGQFTHQVKTWRGDKLVSNETINFVLYDDEYLALVKMFLTKAEVELGEITLDGSTIFVNPEISNNKVVVADTEHDEVILELSFEGEIIKTTTITLEDPVTDGEYYLYDEDVEYETGVYTLTVIVNNGSILAQKRTGIFEIGPLEPKPKSGLKLITFKPGTVNYTILEELPLSGAEYDLPANYGILFDNVDGIPYFSVEWKYYKLRGGSFAEYDLASLTGYPQKITYPEAVSSEKILIFGNKNSTQISDTHDAPATFRAVVIIRDEAGIIVGIYQSDFAFRIALEPGDYSGGLRFLNITGSTVTVVDKNMPKAGRKYPLPPAGTFWSVSVLKFIDELLGTLIEFDEVRVKLEKDGVLLHFMGIDFVNRFTSAEPITELDSDLDANVIGEVIDGLRYCDDPANIPVLIDDIGEYKVTCVALLEDAEVAELYSDFEIIEEAVEPPVKDCCGDGETFKINIGDGVNKIYDIVHGLGTLDVFVELRLNSDGNIVRAANRVIDPNTIRLEFAKVTTVNRFSVLIRKN